MNIKSFLKINALLLAGFFSLSANAATITLGTSDVYGTYSGNDQNAADFMADTGITGVTELFRDEDFCDAADDGCATPGGVFEGTVKKVEYLDYLVVKFDGVYGVYDVTVYSVGDDLVWHTADFYDDCVSLGGNCKAATSHVTGYGVVPVPAAVWLFGSGLIGLVGVARRKSHV